MSKIFIISQLLFLFSCGESPLFNHKLEGKDFIASSAYSEAEAFRFSKTKFSFTLTWEAGPQLGTSKFIMRTWDEDLGTMNGPYQDLPKQLHVFLWMPAMNHGSAPVKLRKISDGEYEVSEVQFIMGGKWEVKFQLKDGSQVFDEVIVPVSL
jgi:nitrogen fixation protein FixH